MKELVEGLRLTLKSAPYGNVTDCTQCFFNVHDDSTGENHCNLCGGCYLDYPLVFVLSDEFDNETVSR